jgi:hypothetical protein
VDVDAWMVKLPDSVVEAEVREEKFPMALVNVLPVIVELVIVPLMKLEV